MALVRTAHRFIYRPDIPVSHNWQTEELVNVTQDPVPCVMAPVGCRNTGSLTPLRLYRVRAMGKDITGCSPNAFEIISNKDKPLFCLWKNCAHLGNWSEVGVANNLRWKLIWVPLDDLPEALR